MRRLSSGTKWEKSAAACCLTAQVDDFRLQEIENTVAFTIL